MKKPLSLKILTGLGAGFIGSMFVALALNSPLGWGIMGVFMYSFLFYAVVVTFMQVMSPAKVVEEIFRRADKHSFYSPKKYFHLFTLAMMVIGLAIVTLSVVVWFDHYIWL
jgi:hypothetical protein